MAARFNELKPVYSKAPDGGTRMEQAAGSKQLKDENLRIGQASNIGEAPPVRVYSRDYSKRDPDGDQRDDTLSQYLGNPLGL